MSPVIKTRGAVVPEKSYNHNPSTSGSQCVEEPDVNSTEYLIL